MSRQEQHMQTLLRQQNAHELSDLFLQSTPKQQNNFLQHIVFQNKIAPLHFLLSECSGVLKYIVSAVETQPQYKLEMTKLYDLACSKLNADIALYISNQIMCNVCLQEHVCKQMQNYCRTKKFTIYTFLYETQLYSEYRENHYLCCLMNSAVRNRAYSITFWLLDRPEFIVQSKDDLEDFVQNLIMNMELQVCQCIWNMNPQLVIDSLTPWCYINMSNDNLNLLQKKKFVSWLFTHIPEQYRDSSFFDQVANIIIDRPMYVQSEYIEWTTILLLELLKAQKHSYCIAFVAAGPKSSHNSIPHLRELSQLTSFYADLQWKCRANILMLHFVVAAARGPKTTNNSILSNIRLLKDILSFLL